MGKAELKFAGILGKGKHCYGLQDAANNSAPIKPPTFEKVGPMVLEVG